MLGPMVLIMFLAFSHISIASDGNLRSCNRADDQQTGWYIPVKEDYHSAYRNDEQNKSHQTWEDYWSWVETFYKGNVLVSGWTFQCKEMISDIRDNSVRSELQRKMNELGKVISREWAKDSRVRKIDSKMVLTWYQQMKEFKARDNGSGEELKARMLRIAAEIEAKIRSK
jgi:hypothetical protein